MLIYFLLWYPITHRSLPSFIIWPLPFSLALFAPIAVSLVTPNHFPVSSHSLKCYFVSFLSFLPDKGREILYSHPFYLVNFSLFILTLNRKSYTPTFPPPDVASLYFQNILGISHYPATLFYCFFPQNSDVQFIYLKLFILYWSITN